CAPSPFFGACLLFEPPSLDRVSRKSVNQVVGACFASDPIVGLPINIVFGGVRHLHRNSKEPSPNSGLICAIYLQQQMLYDRRRCIATRRSNVVIDYVARLLLWLIFSKNSVEKCCLMSIGCIKPCCKCFTRLISELRPSVVSGVYGPSPEPRGRQRRRLLDR